jgi:iron(III) transport system substrate-binding protein
MHCSLRLLALVAGLVATAAVNAGAAGLDASVIEKAKKEGEVVFYTNLIVNQVVRPLAAAFEKKYGIKVTFSRADSQATILKLVNEARAGKTQVDIWNLSSGLKNLVEADVIGKFNAPSSAEYPKEYRDANGYWVATNVYVNTPGYNTNLVPANEVPKTYQDLLAPKWKGKLVWKPNDISGAVGFIGNILTSWGEDKGMAYLRQLGAQNVNTVAIRFRCRSSTITRSSAPRRVRRYPGLPWSRQRYRCSLRASPRVRRTRTRPCCSSIS